MKALKPVSSCNLRLGNPPEFQPPLSLSLSLEMSDSSRDSGWILPSKKNEGERGKGSLTLWNNRHLYINIYIYTLKEKLCQTRKWWMFSGEDTVHFSPSHLVLITSFGHGKIEKQRVCDSQTSLRITKKSNELLHLPSIKKKTSRKLPGIIAELSTFSNDSWRLEVILTLCLHDSL